MRVSQVAQARHHPTHHRHDHAIAQPGQHLPVDEQRQRRGGHAPGADLHRATPAGVRGPRGQGEQHSHHGQGQGAHRGGQGTGHHEHRPEPLLGGHGQRQRATGPADAHCRQGRGPGQGRPGHHPPVGRERRGLGWIGGRGHDGLLGSKDCGSSLLTRAGEHLPDKDGSTSPTGGGAPTIVRGRPSNTTKGAGPPLWAPPPLPRPEGNPSVSPSGRGPSPAPR